MIWEIDSTHSYVSFTIRVMSISTTRGHFHTLRGRLYIDEQNPANSWVDGPSTILIETPSKPASSNIFAIV
jgi:polyisoprenoid-binding protein YceI